MLAALFLPRPQLMTGVFSGHWTQCFGGQLEVPGNWKFKTGESGLLLSRALASPSLVGAHPITASATSSSSKQLNLFTTFPRILLHTRAPRVQPRKPTMLISLTVGKVDAGVAALLTKDKRLVCYAMLCFAMLCFAPALLRPHRTTPALNEPPQSPQREAQN